MLKRLFVVALSVGLMSCSGSSGNDNTLGGDTDVPIGQVGNVVSTGVITIGAESALTGLAATVTANNDGVANVHLVADLSGSPTLMSYADLIHSRYGVSAGVVDLQTKFKATSEGIQDYFNMDDEPFTLIKYDAQVGDTYTFTKSDGSTLTRTVTARSDEDDFPYGFFNIKTITVEQTSNTPGIAKLIYRANHRFGIVHLTVVADDASEASAYVYTDND